MCRHTQQDTGNYKIPYQSWAITETSLAPLQVLPKGTLPNIKVRPGSLLVFVGTRGQGHDTAYRKSAELLFGDIHAEDEQTTFRSIMESATGL